MFFFHGFYNHSLELRRISFVWYSFWHSKTPHLLDGISYCLTNGVLFISADCGDFLLFLTVFSLFSGFSFYTYGQAAGNHVGMNAVDHSTHPEVTTIDTTDEDGNPITTEITETVLVIELTHKTPDEMAADYHFTTRQNTYLQLLQDPQYEELWAELPGGFAQGGGELMSPNSTRTPTGTLQWPLPVAGTITSQFGHRIAPTTGEISSHTGTGIACAEGGCAHPCRRRWYRHRCQRP